MSLLDKWQSCPICGSYMEKCFDSTGVIIVVGCDHCNIRGAGYCEVDVCEKLEKKFEDAMPIEIKIRKPLRIKIRKKRRRKKK